MMSARHEETRSRAPAPLSELPPRAFQTDRLVLRAMEADDAELVFRTYASDPLVTTYLSFPCASHPDDTQPFVRGVADNFAGKPSAHQNFGWLVYRKDSGACIGSVGFGIKDSATLAGGYVFSQAAWGQGFATEAWRPVIAWAQTQAGVQRIQAEHHPDNPASGGVMRKLGLTCEGLLPNAAILPNLGPEKVDMVMWAWERHAS